MSEAVHEQAHCGTVSERGQENETSEIPKFRQLARFRILGLGVLRACRFTVLMKVQGF